MTAWFHAEYTRRDRFWSFQVLLAHMTLFCMTKMCNLFQSTKKPISYRNEWSLILYLARMIAELKSRYESHPEIEWRHLNVIRSPYWFAGPKSAGFIAFGGKWRKIWKLYFSDLTFPTKWNSYISMRNVWRWKPRPTSADVPVSHRLLFGRSRHSLL